MALSVVIAGGGTGGHLYPGIAVARELLARCPDADVSFAGTAQGIEARVVPREGFALDLIRSSGMKGKSPAVAGDRRRRLQFGPGGHDCGVARRADNAARAERGAGVDQSCALAVRPG